MKASTLLLAVSVVANLGLLALHARRSPSTEPAGTSAAGVSSSTATAAHSSSSSASSRPETDTEAAATREWQRFHGGDLKTLVAQLRAAGFPLSVIRIVVQSEINERLAGRRREVYGNQPDVPFWTTGNMGLIGNDPKQRAAMRELNDERQKLYKEALGPDWMDQSEESRFIQQQQYGALPMEKIEQIQRLRQDYSELQQQVHTAANGMLLPEDREKLAFLEKEQRSDLAKLLTPQELEEYDLRSSATASQLRSRLAAFKPTEEEFRAIYKLQKAMDDELGGAYAQTSEQSRLRTEKQRELEKQIAAILPPDRAAEYQLATDPMYNQVSRIAARFNLPTQAVREVVTVQKDVQQRVQALRTQADLPAEQRNQQLAALQQEAQNKVSAALGSRAFEAYKEYGGQWLTNLVPRPRPAQPAPVAPKN
jgi:hypothetical protein